MKRIHHSITAKCLTYGLLAAVALWGAGLAAAEHHEAHGDKKSANKDAAFIKEAAKGGQMEIQMGQLAAENAQSSQVKQFGQKLQQDHSKANQELKQVAQAMGVALPSDVTGKKDQMLEKLQSKSGDEFDKAFIQHALKDHQKDITEYEKALQECENPQLKAYIQKTLPTLRHHLQTAFALGRDVGVDANTLAATSRFLAQQRDMTEGLGTGPSSEIGRGSESELRQTTPSQPDVDRDLDHDIDDR